MNEAEKRLAARAASHDSVFTYEDALAAGLNARQADYRAAHSWVRLHEGVFAFPGAALSWHSCLRAACWAAGDPVAVSHRAGAEFYELPGRRRWVEITCERWKRSQKSGLIVHESSRFDAADIVDHNGIPVVTVERLILELAGLSPFPDSIERVIQAARRKRLITYASTLETFNRLAVRGLRGVQAMRAALDRWDPTSQPTESDMESWLIQVFRAHGLPELETQFVVRDKRGNFVARADGALSKWRITIEYQSKQEHLDEFQSLRDDRRRNAVMAAGYFPLAVRAEDLRTGGERIVGQIRDIARRSAS